MSHSIPNINQLTTRTIHLKRSESTKANSQNLSLPLKQQTTSSHHSSASAKSFHNSKDTHHHGAASSSSASSTTGANREDHNGFGICVKGNKTTGRGVYIAKVEPGSPAYLSGLRAGDAILEINGTPFTALNHEDAVKKCTQILKAEKFCSMTIRSPESMIGATMKYNSFDESQLHQYPRDEELYIPVPHELQAAAAAMGADSGSIHSAPPLKVGCLWIDRHGRSVSPPHDYSHRRDKMDRVRRIELLIESGQSLGLMIRGGIEYGLGIFVTGVDKDSVAERAGLMVSLLVLN
jgi:whirlin